MVTGNEIEITAATRGALAEIFSQQYSALENNSQKLFCFSEGDYALVQEYYNKISYEHLNIVYNHQGQPIMSVFTFSGKRFLRMERLLGQKDLKVIGIRIFKNSIVPMHVDPNYGSTGRENPVLSLVVAGSENGRVYFSNRKDGSKKVMIPGLSQFVMCPTEVEHGANSADQDMDIIQIMVDPI